MKTTIKYDVIFYDGNKGKLKVDYDCPDFEDIDIAPLILNGKHVSDGHTNTIEMQIDEWVGEFDKKEWMNSNDVMIINDWEVVSARTESEPKTNLVIKEKKLTQSEMVGLFIQMAPMSDDLKLEFIAVYKEMKPAIKNLKFDKQIDLTFKGLSIGMKAASQAYKYITEFSKTMGDMKTDDYASISYGERIVDRTAMLDTARNKTLEKINDNDEKPKIL
jgi:hypothetical protein